VVPKTLPDFLVPSSKAHLIAANQAISAGLNFERPLYDEDDTPVRSFLGAALTIRGFPTLLTGTFLPPTSGIMNVYMLQITIAMGKSHCPHFQTSILQ
jgi:hypothetical protein